MTAYEHIQDPALQTLMSKLFYLHMSSPPESTFFLTVTEWNLFMAFNEVCSYVEPIYNGHPVRAISL